MSGSDRRKRKKGVSEGFKMKKECAEKAIMREVTERLCIFPCCHLDKAIDDDKIACACLISAINETVGVGISHDREGIVQVAVYALATLREIDMHCRSCCNENCSDNNDEGDI